MSQTANQQTFHALLLFATDLVATKKEFLDLCAAKL